jgi:hypothetical protein
MTDKQRDRLANRLINICGQLDRITIKMTYARVPQTQKVRTVTNRLSKITLSILSDRQGPR